MQPEPCTSYLCDKRNLHKPCYQMYVHVSQELIYWNKEIKGWMFPSRTHIRSPCTTYIIVCIWDGDNHDYHFQLLYQMQNKRVTKFRWSLFRIGWFRNMVKILIWLCHYALSNVLVLGLHGTSCNGVFVKINLSQTNVNSGFQKKSEVTYMFIFWIFVCALLFVINNTCSCISLFM